VKSLKGLLWIVAVIVVVFTVVVPGSWLWAVSSLPRPIESELDIETALRQSIESERQSWNVQRAERDRKPVKWDHPDISRLPKHLVALYITETGCPTYFQTPREDGMAWNKRIAYSMMDKQLEGDGACELIFARRIARRLQVKSTMQLAAAADRIHRFLQKDQLVAFDLMSQWYEPDVIGVDSAAQVLLQKKLSDMSLAELAELQIGIPPLGYWHDLKQCTNASLVKQARDSVIGDLARSSLISEDMAHQATAEPVRCLSVQR